MTNLESLKNNIENNSLKDDLIIFELSDIDFISNQYIQKISELKHLDIEYLDSLEAVNERSIFEEVNVNLDTLKVFKCDKLDKFNDSLIFEKNITYSLFRKLYEKILLVRFIVHLCAYNSIRK